MSPAVTTWALAATGWVLLVGGIGTENMTALWIAMGIGAGSLVLICWLTQMRANGTRAATGQNQWSRHDDGTSKPTLTDLGVAEDPVKADNRARRPRRNLIEAQVAIFENQDRDEAAGVHEETEEYHRLHEHYYALADRVPWWRRVGVWHAALAEHDRRCRGGVRR